MPNCMAIKADHTPCGRNAQPHLHPLPVHLHFCSQHRTLYHRRAVFAGQHVPGKCLHFLTTQRWCTHDAEADSTVCVNHRRRREAAEARQNAAQLRAVTVTALVADLLEIEPRPTWQEAVRILVQLDDRGIGHTAAIRYYYHAMVRALDAPPWQNHDNPPIWRFTAYWVWARQGAVGPPPNVDLAEPPARLPGVPLAPLARLADDAQNVHTTVVSNQTNAGMEKILATVVPKEQQTEKSIMSAWMAGLTTVGWSTILKTAADVNYWFNMKTCRVANDSLYRNMLRGLVAMINKTDDEQKSELYKRLWEECREATGMCCEGHITRLCNVMVGFDDAFQPPVALGDLMQQKMAAIAGLDVDEEEKRRQANAWFDEVAVPVADRAAWLEAF